MTEKKKNRGSCLPTHRPYKRGKKKAEIIDRPAALAEKFATPRANERDENKAKSQSREISVAGLIEAQVSALFVCCWAIWSWLQLFERKKNISFS